MTLGATGRGGKMGYKSLLFMVCLAMTALVTPAATAGTNTFDCFAEPATIVGTPGDDVLIGREDTADVIVGLGGDDIIFGAEDINAATAPGDRLCGGSGDDRIRGGVGEDRIQGGSGEDDVDGGFGSSRGAPAMIDCASISTALACTATPATTC
jgi:hypothetical protein